MSVQFSQPTQEQAATAESSSGGYLRQIRYAAFKTPEAFAATAKNEVLVDAMQKSKLGFSYYDKEAKEAVPFGTTFSFVMLEVYSCIAGDNGESGDGRVSFFSNRVKDTRTDTLRVFQSGKKGAIAEGIYQDFKNNLPKGAGYQTVGVVLCLNDNTVYELPLTAALQRGLQHALADSARAAGQKNAKWEKMKILGLTDTDLIWGFNFTKFEPETKEGLPYAGKGDLFFAPRFSCGILQPLGETVEMHKQAVAAQTEIRAAYAKRSANREATTQPENNATANNATANNVTANNVTATQPQPVRESNPFAVDWSTPGTGASTAGDDLPF